MTVIRLDLAYDGTGFRGWARQRGQRTVQRVLEDALERVLRAPVHLSVAGRTDAGVHARPRAAGGELRHHPLRGGDGGAPAAHHRPQRVPAHGGHAEGGEEEEEEPVPSSKAIGQTILTR